MVNLSRRQFDILTCLSKNNTMTSQALGNSLHVSSKTIRSEIKEVNSLFNEPCILSSKGSGFSVVLNHEALLLLEKEKDQMPASRNFSVLKELLTESEINFYELAERLFISEATLQRCISDLNDIVSKRYIPIRIKRQFNNIYLDGNEEGRRQATTYFLMYEINEYDFDLKNYLHFFQALNLNELKEYVISFNKENNTRMKDFEIISFVIHVAIMIERVLQGNEVVSIDEAMPSEEHFHLAKQFELGLKDIVEIKLSDAELGYLSCLFAGKLPIIESEHLDAMKVFIAEILETIKIQYDVDLADDEEFKNNFLIHLMGLRKRIKNQTFLNNPLMQDIKNYFPIVYDIRVFIAMKIQEKFETDLYEEEIGYITLHLLGSLERMHKSSQRKVLVFSPMGEAGNGYLRSKLSNIHELSVEVCDIVSIFDTGKIKQYQPDLIISFLKIPEETHVQVYQCESLLTDNDIEKIYTLLKEKTEIHHAENFFDESLFFSNKDFTTKEEVIEFLCEQLQIQGYVDKDYVELVLKREKTAPTAYGNLFAIPHPIEKKAKQNMVAVCSLSKAIQWSEQKVKLVFLFSLSKQHSESFDKLFEQLVGLLDDESCVKQLTRIEDFDSFMNCFLGRE